MLTKLSLAALAAVAVLMIPSSYADTDDSYVFGAGDFSPDPKIYKEVMDAVLLYEWAGAAAFDVITPEKPLITAAFYPFVLNGTDLSTVAHGTIPSFVGVCCSDAIQNSGDRPIEEILADLNEHGGTWVEYPFTNPDTGTQQLKRTWLFQYGDYIFGSGYYLQDSRVQSLVDEAIYLYETHGTGAFSLIAPDPDPDAEPNILYAFVLDEDTLEIKAHATQPELVGTVNDHLNHADILLDDIRDGLDREEGIWVGYLSENPNTRTDQLTRTYLAERDGLIFGAGYYFPDSRIQSLVDEAIYTYRSNGDAGFAIINSDLIRDDIYAAARNATHVLANAGSPHLMGYQYAEAVTDSSTKRDAGDSYAQPEGETLYAISSRHPPTETTQVKILYGMFYDGIMFASLYTIPDADTQSVVDYAMFIYENNQRNNAWVDIITPDEPVVTDAVYPFVLNATDWSTVAHGTLPDLVGQCCSTAIQETSIEPFGEVRAELDRDGNAWVTYEFLNPDTGTIQLKRTWLVERDGLIFGAGYYIMDSQIQSIVFRTTLDFDQLGKDDTFEKISAVPEEPNSLYPFVVDPATGTILVQGVDPELIGMASDWEAALEAEPDLPSKLESESGEYVSYEFLNPVTNEVETKRTWLTLHEGYVYGVGYYASDATGYGEWLRSQAAPDPDA